jgi:hypothetical protein
VPVRPLFERIRLRVRGQAVAYPARRQERLNVGEYAYANLVPGGQSAASFSSSAIVRMVVMPVNMSCFFWRAS